MKDTWNNKGRAQRKNKGEDEESKSQMREQVYTPLHSLALESFGKDKKSPSFPLGKEVG